MVQKFIALQKIWCDNKFAKEKSKIALQKIWCYKIATVDQLIQPVLPLYNQSFHSWIRTKIGQSIPANWKMIGDCKQQLIKQNMKQK